MAGATSSIGHTDTVDMVNGMPLFAAALAACTSPRLAYIPVNPTGARAIGKANSSLKTVVERSSDDIFLSTCCFNAMSAKSASLRLSVCSR